jgi:hypothetical protein
MREGAEDAEDASSASSLNPVSRLNLACVWSGAMIAGAARLSRKVRAPPGRLPGNAWAPKGDGQGHRKQTAPGRRKPAGVRVKRWGKSPPRRW